MEPTYLSSGLLTGNGQIFLGMRYLGGATIITDGTNVVTLTVFDGTDDTGVVLLKGACAGPDKSQSIVLPAGGVRARIGLYVKLEGTAAQAVVYHK